MSKIEDMDKDKLIQHIIREWKEKYPKIKELTPSSDFGAISDYAPFLLLHNKADKIDKYFTKEHLNEFQKYNILDINYIIKKIIISNQDIETGINKNNFFLINSLINCLLETFIIYNETIQNKKDKPIKEHKEIKIYIETISHHLRQADAAFKIYCALLRLRSKSRIKLFNKAVYTFHHLTNIALYDFINNIYKITESERNITFKKLKLKLNLDKNDEHLKEISEITCKIKKPLGKIKNIRVKLTAHLSEESTNSKIILKTTQIKEVRFILDELLKLINIYRSIFLPENLDFFYDKFDDKFDDELLQLFICLKQDKSYNYYEKLKNRLESYKNHRSLLHKIEELSNENK
ncbi:hypothetical protein [Gallibacterium anatis]|uniref:hypothetical protein n=1 Tax=Gallibacterium anatis TaxID=750 RepID=UPI000BA04729|nr:hypothetical protein [Gallibacterium anatis]WAX71718.1 hypothetical protein CF557_01320 [Gallibacterium anatis]